GLRYEPLRVERLFHSPLATLPHGPSRLPRCLVWMPFKRHEGLVKDGKIIPRLLAVQKMEVSTFGRLAAGRDRQQPIPQPVTYVKLTIKNEKTHDIIDFKLKLQ